MTSSPRASNSQINLWAITSISRTRSLARLTYYDKTGKRSGVPRVNTTMVVLVTYYEAASLLVSLNDQLFLQQLQ